MESDKKNYITKKRTFKDAWAFILYLIYYLGCNGALVMLNLENGVSVDKFNFKLLGVLATSTSLLIVLAFLLFAFMCEFTLKLSLIVYPILQAAAIFFFPSIMMIISGGLGLIIWFAFIWAYWSRIPIVAAILSYSTKICLSHFFSCVFGMVVCSVIQTIQIALTFMVIPKLDQNTSVVVIVAVFLNFFWTMANFNYFFKVYVSSIIAYHFVKYGEGNVFGDTITNTLYALGSISYAGLVIACVQTCRMLIDRERSREDRRNLLTSILLCVLGVILALIEDIVRFANNFSMPYIAIHGCGYTEAVKSSFRLITRESSVALGGVTLLNCALFVYSLVMMGVTYGLFMASRLGSDLKFEFNDKLVVNTALCTIAGVSVLYYIAMSTFISAYLGLIYLYTERPTLISEVDSKIADTLKKSTVV